MTVKQIMNKLKKVPEDYEVTVDNDGGYYDGIYKAIGIDIDEDNKHVEIVTGHIYRWSQSEKRWRK